MNVDGKPLKGYFMKGRALKIHKTLHSTSQYDTPKISANNTAKDVSGWFLISTHADKVAISFNHLFEALSIAQTQIHSPYR